MEKLFSDTLTPQLKYQHHDKSYTETNQDTYLWPRKRGWTPVLMVEVVGSRHGQGLWQQKHLLSEETFNYQPETGLGKNLRALTPPVTFDT